VNRKEYNAFMTLVEALEFMTMPLTTPIKDITLERLLATMAEDEKRGKKALAKVRRILKK
jgi:hypothetical protein